MNDFVLDNRTARRIFMQRHLLSDTPTGPAKNAEILDVVTKLGFVQLDSISTIARAHDLILFTRKAQYQPKVLKAVYEQDGALFEHWTHDAAVIPLEFYRHWQLRRNRDAARLKGHWKDGRRKGFETKIQAVLDQIRDQGPCCPSDVGKDEKRGSGGWWDWHPSKTALEYLWRSGALHVIGRDGFQKRYDLTERVLEQHVFDPSISPDEVETIDWCCNQSLDRLGFATHAEMAAFWAHITPVEAKIWCVDALARGDIIQIMVQGADAQLKPAFARPNIASDPAIDIKPTARLRVLSPFDPALRDRKRAARLFGFNYTVEMFVPEPKRKYGYYVFPLLEGDRLVGRVDMKAFRDQDTLRVKALWPERGVRWTPARAKAFEAEVQRLTKLAGVTKVAFDDNWLRLDPI